MSFGERVAALPTPSKVGLALCLVGFVFRLTCSSSTTENGELVSCSYFDAGALMIAGGILWCAGVTGSGLGAADEGEARFRRGVTAVLLAFAVLHALRGLGVIGGPC